MKSNKPPRASSLGFSDEPRKRFVRLPKRLSSVDSKVHGFRQQNKLEPIVTFPEWGNFSIAIDAILRDLGVKTIRYKSSNNQHLEVGVSVSPESICFCFKPMLGGLLEAVEKGANSLIWFDSHGQCRARYYSWLQGTILKRLNYPISFYIFDGKNIINVVKKISGKGSVEILKSAYLGYRVLKLIDKAELKSYWYRPREKHKGDTDKAFKQSLKIIEESLTHEQITKANKLIDSLFDQIPIKSNEPKKILVLGEIYLIHDPFGNHNLLKILGDLGFEVVATNRALDLVKHTLFHKYYEYKTHQITKHYLDVHIGGHARESLMELLTHKSDGLAGVVHVGPFGCMPEVTVNPILQSVAKEYHIPYLYLTFDVQTSDTGLLTRLEAFADLTNNITN